MGRFLLAMCTLASVDLGTRHHTLHGVRGSKKVRITQSLPIDRRRSRKREVKFLQSLSEVVEALRDREFRWNSWAVYTIAVIFYFALIVGPKTLGSAEGARDAHPEHSTLPFVVLQGQTNEEWRLLRISGEKFY